MAKVDVRQPPGLQWGFPFTVFPETLIGPITIGLANDERLMRWHGGGSISKVGLHIPTSSGNICVSVYPNSGSGVNQVPGARLATSGSVASPGTGYQEISLGSTVTVKDGDWVGVWADNTTVTFLGLNASSGTTNLMRALAAEQAGVSPPPATPSGLIYQNNRFISCVGVA